jgi:hypothetical protein
LLGGDGGGGVAVGGGGSITHSGGSDYTGVGGSHEGGEDQYLRLEKSRKMLKLFSVLLTCTVDMHCWHALLTCTVDMHLGLVTHFNHSIFLFYLSVDKTVATHVCVFIAVTR